jgi:hypothetical protein
MKHIGRKLFLLAFACLTMMGVMEGMLRMSGLVPPHGYPQGLFVTDPDTGYRMAPGFPETRFSKQEFSTVVFTNAQGFRDIERQVPPAQDGFRILVIGDSFVWGAYGVDCDGTFSRLAETELQQKYPAQNIEVINLGVVGWGTDQALSFLKAHGDSYHADAVVLGFCIANDFYDNLRTGEYTVQNGFLVETASVGSDHLLRKIRNWLVARSRLIQLLERAVFQLPALQPLLRKQEALRFHGKNQINRLFELDQPEQNDLIEPTAALIAELSNWCKKRQITLSLLPIPSAIQVDADPQSSLDAGAATPDKMEVPFRELEKICEQNGVQFISTLELLRDAARQTPIFWNLNPHFNPAGNASMAKILGEHLELQLPSD